ncbi:amidohydrolase family protein [Ancylobacter mangrovi]|uniref:amidohydrolase family protein n=1 Tax=Ancylobacter mangrovi TaxID=2972472 RepID=UPI0021633C98|nr:amidohydrolase family protein [Ancylobacter mangrovi]MCS0500854.1 amidohydrolase family protein [Ancylobacter mangrovi]
MSEPYVYRGATYRDPAALAEWLAGTPPEAALEPELAIVDPHHHIWENSKRGRYLLHEFLADVNESGHDVRRTVFAECEAMYRADGPEPFRPVGEVEFVRGVAAMSASGQYGPLRVAHRMIGHADLTLGGAVREVLEAEIDAGGGRLSGIRVCAAWDGHHEEIGRYVAHQVPPGHLLNPALHEGAAVLAELGLNFETWVFFHQLPDVIALARAVPQATIIVDHVGGPICVGPYAGRRQELFEVWRGHMRELATSSNVHVKLGGLGMLHFGFDFHLRDVPPPSTELAQAWRPYMETAIEAFGVERAMFESNFPVDKQSCRYGTLWNALKRIAGNASVQEKEALFAGTASRVYRL